MKSKSCCVSFAKELNRRFGKQPSYGYSLEQVTEAAAAFKPTGESLTYAHALFCTKADFNALHQSAQDACDYERRRTEIRGWFKAEVDDGVLAAVLLMMG